MAEKPHVPEEPTVIGWGATRLGGVVHVELRGAEWIASGRMSFAGARQFAHMILEVAGEEASGGSG